VPKEAPQEERVALTPTEASSAPGAGAEPEAAKRTPGREMMRVRVRDEYGNRVPLAEIGMTMMCSIAKPSSSHGWREEPSSGVTGPDGEVSLWYPRTIFDADDGHLETGTVGFRVSHPDYTTFAEHRQKVSEELVVVTLARGGFVVVSGWVEDEVERILDVEVLLDDEVRVRDEEWLTVADGRWSCGKIPPGVHAIAISWEGPDGPYHSEVTEFELVPGDHTELHLQLHPGRTLFGVVASEVPRPIIDGEAWLCVYHYDDERNLRVFRRYETAIAADGTFSFLDLPPGNGEVIAMCEGWTSAFVRDPESPVLNAVGLLQVDPETTRSDDPWVLEMVPSARVELTVLTPEGEPLQNARVASWPNVHWTMGYSQIFLERSWLARTDRFGRATLENMPPLPMTMYSVEHEDYRMPMQTGDNSRSAWFELAVGETLNASLTMEGRD
jgi:hypothetical protein